MYQRGKLATKLLFTGVSLLVLALSSIGLTLWVTWQLDGGAAAVNEAGRMRMQTWRLASAVQSGRPSDEVRGYLKQFDASIELLRKGDPTRPLFVPWNKQTQAEFKLLNDGWHRLRWAWDAAADATDRNPAGTDQTVQAAHDFVETVNAFVLSIEQQMSRLTAILNMFQFMMMALAIAAAVLLLYVGHLFVIDPLHRLRDGMRLVEGGDFNARIEDDTADEFGEVAAGFNHMTATLHNLYHGLETKVREKTASLQAQGDRLSALYEVSTFLAGTHSLEELAKGFARKVRRLSHADAVAVRWNSDADQKYMLLASDCLPEELVREEHCIQPGSCECGQVPEVAYTRVIPIVSNASSEQPSHCVKAGFVAMVSVPVRLQSRVLGEIELFYRNEVRLSNEERGLLDALASHLASAVENLRVEALVRESAVSEERTMLARELHDSIAQSLSFLKIQLGLLRGAIEKGDAKAVDTALNELDEGVRESTNDVRELLVHFRTRTNSEDIEQALRITLQKFQHQSGVPAELELSGAGVSLPSDVQLQALHIVQEALSNVRKHAQASRVWLHVSKSPHWSFSVRDNGKGFEAGDMSQGGTHVGLQIMRERAERIGGCIRVESAPGHGTEVRLDLVT